MRRTATTVGTAALLIGATALQMCNGLAITSSSRVTPTIVSAAAESAAAGGSEEAAGTYQTLPRKLMYESMKARYAESREGLNKYSHHDDADSVDDEDDDPNFFAFEVNSFQELQRSTGPDILDDKLQLQIDEATDHPDRFLDAHVDDATLMEKVAMSSVPEQLPKPAVNALSQRSNTNNASTLKDDAVDGTKSSKTKKSQRVTPAEEIELAKMIQSGVKLFSLKSDYEEANGRKLDRQEWAELAGLDSAKKLRRAVADYRKAKQLLVSANMGLVHAVVKGLYYNSGANRNNRRYNGVPFDELVQEGSLGLIRAAELFDPSRGLRFSTYATIWIKGALSNSHIAETVTLPQREKAKWNKIASARQALEQADGDGNQPTTERLAKHLGMDVSDVAATTKKMNQVRKVLSLDYEYAVQTRSGVQSGTLNKIENDKAFRADADLAEHAQFRADIVATLARNLDAREARLMRLRYGLVDGHTRTIRECAEAMGLSQGRTNVIAKNCLKKLREAADAESLQEYLLTIA